MMETKEDRRGKKILKFKVPGKMGKLTTTGAQKAGQRTTGLFEDRKNKQKWDIGYEINLSTLKPVSALRCFSGHKSDF